MPLKVTRKQKETNSLTLLPKQNKLRSEQLDKTSSIFGLFLAQVISENKVLLCSTRSGKPTSKIGIRRQVVWNL